MPPITKLNTELNLDSRKFTKGIGSARKKLNVFEKSLGGLQTRLIGVFGAAGTGFLIKKAISTMADFESKMSGLKAVTGATSKEMKEMTKVARDLGSKTAFSATQAADGMEFLARAGFKTNEIIASTPDVLNLAAAGAIDLGRAADISSNILGAFSFEAKQMTRVVDVMAKTTASANTDIEQLGEAMKLSAPIANSFGISIEETAASIGILSNSGLQGTVAGTGLKNVLLKLISPSSELKKAMGGLTLESDGLTAVLKQIKASGLPAASAMKLFGKIAGNSFLVLSAGIKDLKELNSELENAGGTAETMAKIKMKNLTGAFLGFKSAIDDVVLTLGDMGVLEALTRLMENMATSTRLAGKAMREFGKDVNAAFGVFGDDDFSSIDAALKRERQRLKALQESAKLAALIPGSNLEEIEKEIEARVRFLAVLIKLKKQGVQPATDGKIELGKTAPDLSKAPPGGTKTDSDIKTLFESIDLVEILDKKRDTAFDKESKRQQQHAILEKEITAELKQEIQLLTIQASGNEKLFALKEKLFELEGRLGRKLSENETIKLEAFIAETERLNKLVAKNEETGQQITEIWEAVGRKTEDAIVDAMMGASSALDAFKNVALAILEDITREMIRTSLIKPIFGGDGGVGGFLGTAASSFFGSFAHGGSFTVPGSGGTDSSPVSFMATPGEQVQVSTPGQTSDEGGGAVTIVQNISTGVAQTVRAEMMQLIPQIIEQAKRGVFDANRRGGEFNRV